MPSIIPSYVYTLFAMMIVGTLLIGAFTLSTINIKNDAEDQQLKRIAEYVAAKGCELLSVSKAEVIQTSLTLDVPVLVGNQQYWIRLENDSSSAWVETGYGTIPSESGQRVLIPFDVSASGGVVSGLGVAVLKCNVGHATTYLELSGGY